MHPHLSDKAMKNLDERFKIQIEAVDLLQIIAAEFETDPLSVQCFDLRVVKRVKALAKKWDSLEKNIFNP